VGRFLPVVLGSIAYGIVTIGVGVAPVYPVAAALMVLVGVCGALMAPATMALVTDLVEPEARGAAMGLFNVFGSLGFLAGFLIGGSATDLFGYTPAFLAVGGLELAIALALFPAVRSIAPGDGLLGLGGGTGRSPSGDSPSTRHEMVRPPESSPFKAPVPSVRTTDGHPRGGRGRIGRWIADTVLADESPIDATVAFTDRDPAVADDAAAGRDAEAIGR